MELFSFIKLKLKSSYKENGLNIFINPNTYLELRKSKEYFNFADNVFLDGWLMCFLYRYFFRVNVSRASFDYSSIAHEVFTDIHLKGKSLALIGSTEFVIEKFSLYIKAKYPGINLVYARNGYFSSEEEKALCCKAIESMGVNSLIVGMGAPHQEKFLSMMNQSNWKGEAFTCGGFFHQTVDSEGVYYPQWVDKYNLRAFYRMYKEPKLIKRYLLSYSKFLLVFLLDNIKNKKYD